MTSVIFAAARTSGGIAAFTSSDRKRKKGALRGQKRLWGTGVSAYRETDGRKGYPAKAARKYEPPARPIRQDQTHHKNGNDKTTICRMELIK